MRKIKITISGEDRIVMIPMEYDENTDSLSFAELQIEPELNKNEDISKDIIMQITHFLLSAFKSM